MKYDPDFRQPTAQPLPCDMLRLQAAAWIDGESPGSTGLTAHLEACEDCRGFVEDLHTLSARLAPLRAAGPAADLWPAIAARARASARPKERWKPLARRVAAALIACAGMAALLEAASRMARAPRNDGAVGRVKWPAALHQESTALRELESAPEQRLLASIDPTLRGKR